jgi:hypothetical protein
MTRLDLSRLSKVPPEPHSVIHIAGKHVFDVGYTCHMAAMHWAAMALGHSQKKANEIVSGFTKKSCRGCLGNGNHASVSPSEYGKAFCSTGTRIANKNALHDMVDVGDVLVTGHPSMPMHTMVLRQKRGEDHITVRGFNNFGTLGTGVRDHYDPVSHNIAQDKYWKNSDQSLFGQIGEPLYLVKHDSFIAAIRQVSQKFG